MAHLFESDVVSEYEYSSDSESDSDESPNYKPYAVDQVEQKLTKADSSELSMKHKVPLFVSLVPIGPNQSTVIPLKGMIALCTKHLESDLTLPFPDIIHIFLHYLGIAPSQLNPNVWKVIVGCIISWKRECFPPFSFNELRYSYGIGKHPEPHTGFFYASNLPRQLLDHQEFFSYQKLEG